MTDVIRMKFVEKFIVELEFDDDLIGEIDLAPFLIAGVFTALKEDRDLFLQGSVDSEAGTIVWPNGADFAPDMLHREITASQASSR